MKRFVAGADRAQSTLLPESLDDWVDESNPVRVIDVFVDALNIAELGFEGVEPAATGRPSYHPSSLLKLYIYGYLNRVQSSRRLEREAGRNVEVMWLLGRLAPDHKTIADFRKDNGGAINKVCVRDMRRAFPDLELTIEQQIAEVPWVATRVTFRGTHAGEYMGIPATGRRIEYAGTVGSLGRWQSGGDVAHRKHAPPGATNCRERKPATETMIDSLAVRQYQVRSIDHVEGIRSGHLDSGRTQYNERRFSLSYSDGCNKTVKRRPFHLVADTAHA